MGIMKSIKGNKKRAALVGLAALGALGVGSFGAYSFFTDQGTIVNDFTTGRVDITEKETVWTPDEPGPDGQKDGDNIYPGYTRHKNPSVKNTAGITNNNSWVKATIRFLDQNGEQITDAERDRLIFYTLRYDAAAVTDGVFDEAKATLLESDGKGTGKYNQAEIEALKNINPEFGDAEVAEESEVGKHVFYLQAPLLSGDTAEAGQEVTLFTHIALPTEWTQDQLDIMGDYHIEVTFDGIQEMGFDNVNDAMAALNAEENRHKDYKVDDANRNEDRLNQSGDNSGRGDSSFNIGTNGTGSEQKPEDGDKPDEGDDQNPDENPGDDQKPGGEDQKPGGDEQQPGGDEQNPDDSQGGEGQKPGDDANQGGDGQQPGGDGEQQGEGGEEA